MSHPDVILRAKPEGSLFETIKKAAKEIGFHKVGITNAEPHEHLTLTNLDLDEDKPETDHCGSCTRCIDACPTEALVEPYTIDARRCISYLTIEKRGEFGADEKRMISPYLYGCDICQQVCPWNDKASTPALSCFCPREGNLSPDPKEFISMNQEAFSKRFKKSPMKRAKLDGLKRNAKALLDRASSSEK